MRVGTKMRSGGSFHSRGPSQGWRWRWSSFWDSNQTLMKVFKPASYGRSPSPILRFQRTWKCMQAAAILVIFVLLFVFVLLHPSSDKIAGLKTRDHGVLVDLMTNLAMAMSAGPRLRYNDVFNRSEKHLHPHLFPGSLAEEHNKELMWRGPEAREERWCGNSAWRDSYAAFHNYMRESSRRNGTKRFLTYSNVLQGLADVYVGIVTSYVLAFLDQRALLIDHQCIKLTFEPANIDWRITPDVPMNLTRNGGTVPYDNFLENLGWIPDLAEHMTNNFRGSENVYITVNRGYLVRTYDNPTHKVNILQQKAMGFRIAESFGCLFHQVLRLKDEVKKIVEPEVKAISKPASRTLCIQFRLMDEFAWERDGTQKHTLSPSAADLLANSLHCAQKVEDYYFPPPVTANYLLVTNSELIKNQTKAILPNKVWITHLVAKHMQYYSEEEAKAQACRETTAEWHLLSYCDAVVIPHIKTAFAKTAVLTRMNGEMMFLQDGCDPSRPIPIRDLANWWSCL